MSLRREMLQVARLAPKVLGDSTDLVQAFVRSQQNPDGGFKDRAGHSDLYYTVFGLESLLALRAPVNPELVVAYLRQFAGGESLDLVHACCLARCWAAVADLSSIYSVMFVQEWRDALLSHIESFRSRDGGYYPKPGNEFGTAYGCFLGLAANQDLQHFPPKPVFMSVGRLRRAEDRCWRTAYALPSQTHEERDHVCGLTTCLARLCVNNEAWSNDPLVREGSTNATAAAIAVLRQMGERIPAGAGTWLLGRMHTQGGFLAGPAAPMPDLLTTATALHALTSLGASLDSVKEACLDFVDTLWTNNGGFHGHWADDTLDCEYTFYGLLALGHLS